MYVLSKRLAGAGVAFGTAGALAGMVSGGAGGDDGELDGPGVEAGLARTIWGLGLVRTARPDNRSVVRERATGRAATAQQKTARVRQHVSSRPHCDAHSVPTLQPRARPGVAKGPSLSRTHHTAVLINDGADARVLIQPLPTSPIHPQEELAVRLPFAVLHER